MPCSLRSTQDSVELIGDGGFGPALVKAALEHGLRVELTTHLGCDKHAVEGRGSGNSRNGTTSKTVESEVGAIELDVPSGPGWVVHPASGLPRASGAWVVSMA